MERSLRKTFSQVGSSFRKKTSFRKRSNQAKPISIADAFKVFDKDGSGALSVEELQAVLTRPGGGAPLSLEEVAAIVEEFDANGDGAYAHES